MNNITVLVTEDLNFNVSRIFKVFFGINIRVAKEILSLRLAKIHISFNFIIISDDSHTFSAAAGCGFKNYRVSNSMSEFLNFLNSFHNTGSRSNRNIIFNHCFTSSCFITHFSHSFCCRTDKFYVMLRANFCKICSFGHKTVSRVNCVSAGHKCCRNNCWNTQITFSTLSRPDAISFSSQSYVQRICISLRINSNCRNSQLSASSYNSNGNFASVSD